MDIDNVGIVIGIVALTVSVVMFVVGAVQSHRARVASYTMPALSSEEDTLPGVPVRRYFPHDWRTLGSVGPRQAFPCTTPIASWPHQNVGWRGEA